MPNLLAFPFEAALLLRRRRAMVAELAQRPALTEVRVALLGGSTTSSVKDFLELFLLDSGLRPAFHESEYGKYEEDVLVDDTALRAFAPHVAIVYTTWVNARIPSSFASDDVVEAARASELARFEAIWAGLAELDCTIIQNNFDEPAERGNGHLESTLAGGASHFLRGLNLDFARAARRTPRLVIHDMAYLSALVGLGQWHDRGYWFSYKLAVSPVATITVAHHLAAIVRAIFGRTKKCLILDLDNTLWGGVIGDDGLGGIKLGKETPEGEAFTAFQTYCLALKQRGILLAVCSKNEPVRAQEGFTHPDSVLSPGDFAAFKAGWGPKHEAIVEIAHELNLGLDSFVFVDDNPAERELVRSMLPMVSVPEVGDDPARYVELLDGQLYFEPLGISGDDRKRTEMYASNVQRNLARATHATYGDFLDSLEMKAEIAQFSATYIDRIAQLTNKTNQFNLTTRRCTVGEIEAMRADANAVTLYGRLADKFGDNGLVTVVAGHGEQGALVVDLWLMSCRVLKRDLEHAMLDALVAAALERGFTAVHGRYLRTPKNAMVADLYARLGFEQTRHDDDGSEWSLRLDAPYTLRNTHIKDITRG